MKRYSVRSWLARSRASLLMACCTVLGAFPVFAQSTVATNYREPAVEERAEAMARDVLSRPVTIRLDRVPLREALAEIARTAAVLIQYRGTALVNTNTLVSLDVTKMPLGTALERVLQGTTLQAVPFSRDVITIVRPKGEAARDGIVAGKVVHAKTKQPLSGITVLLDNATRGVTTDENGMFRLSVAPGEHHVHAKGLGYVKQSQQVTVRDGELTGVDFALEPSASVLNEVVVTGTVVATERKAISTPVTVITADDIEKRGITRVDQLLRGEIPGVIAVERGSAVYSSTILGAMASTKMYSRGGSTLDGGATPLKTYVDGVELLDPSYLGTLDPRNIERIEVVTGPQAATVYGSGAMGGVMQIFTKKGNGRQSMDLTLSAQYGILQNNLTDGMTPSHNDAIKLMGGSGPVLSYAVTLSHVYTGQWQPHLYNRMLAGSVGATHVRGPWTVNGSVGVTSGRNGTSDTYGNQVIVDRINSGEWMWYPNYLVGSGIEARSSGRTMSTNADYRASSSWQHNVTLGMNEVDLDLVPRAPRISNPSDTLFQTQLSTGRRTTAGYSTTLSPQLVGPLSGTMTLGANGSWGRRTIVTGSLADLNTATYNTATVTRSVNDQNWGVFGRWQLGVFDHLYLSYAVRGERNDAYGQDLHLDWTPTMGATYAFDMGDLTVKLLASSGRATRTPDPDYRLPVTTETWDGIDPAQYVSQIANPNLTPEYSRGPQGGIELYYGNIGSLTINRYEQKVTDLIQHVLVDSILATDLPSNTTFYLGQYQYLNAARVRQYGWEGTAGINLGRLTLKGTYSWSEARITRVNPLADAWYVVGGSFIGVPTHTGNVTGSYASGGTSITLTTNFVGQMLDDLGRSGGRGFLVFYNQMNGRLRMYNELSRAFGFGIATPRKGYAKTDLTISQRLTSRASFTATVVNLGNSYGSEAYNYNPALGRQTLLGFTLRNPFTR